MKPYLVDVPVNINIWIRPDCQRKQFEIIKRARPSILFIQSDGGRNDKEWEAIRQNRELIDNGIDWQCQVYRLYEEQNNGLYAMGKKTSSLIWSKVDRCIFLEDDILPSVSFFRYCADLLEYYKDDQRIECICGMNHLGRCDDVQSDYFFSRQGSIWGTATWKRVIDERGSFDYSDDPYVMRVLKQRTCKNKFAWEQLIGYSKNKIYNGHVAGGEFWYQFHMYSQNRLQVIPKVNLVSNVGTTEDSAHADRVELLPRGLRRVFNMETYEMEFPLKHAKYVMPDVEYEKKRNWIMGRNPAIHRYARKIERAILLLRYKGISSVMNKLRSINKQEK